MATQIRKGLTYGSTQLDSPGREIVPSVLSGAGSPEGVVFAPRGSFYTDGDTALIYNKTTDFLLSTGWAEVGSGGGTGANPTASVGLAAVNGALSTFLRSDGAPALDQSIAPTWTGVHAFNNVTIFNNTLIAGVPQFSGLFISNPIPRELFQESGAAADEGFWDKVIDGAHLFERTRTDADGAGKNWLDVDRGTGTAIANISFGNATDNPTYNFLGTSRVGCAGLAVTEGANAKMGVATLVGGTVVVNTTAVTANSRIFLTCQALGTVAVPSGYGVSARVAATSFTILASAPTDTSVIAWMIVEPQ